MKSKTYLYLGIFAVLLIGAYFLTADRGEKTASYKLEKSKLFEIDSANVDKLEIKTKEGKLVIAKTAGEWKITEPVPYAANSSFVENAISGLKNMKIESLVSSNPSNQSSYGFTEADQAEITVYQGGAEKGKFILGNPSDQTTLVFVKKAGGNDVLLADKINRFDFVKPNFSEWRDKNIFGIPKQTVKEIEFSGQGETFTVKSDTSGKYYIGSDSVGSAFDGILNVLQNFQTQNFLDTTLGPETRFTDIIKVNHGNVTELRYLKADTSANSKYLLQVQGNNQIFEFDEGVAKNVLKTKKEILGR